MKFDHKSFPELLNYYRNRNICINITNISNAIKLNFSNFKKNTIYFCNTNNNCNITYTNEQVVDENLIDSNKEPCQDVIDISINELNTLMFNFKLNNFKLVPKYYQKSDILNLSFNQSDLHTYYFIAYFIRTYFSNNTETKLHIKCGKNL